MMQHVTKFARAAAQLAARRYSERDVPLGELKIHPVVQRHLREPHVREIAETFNQDKMGRLYLSLQNGRLYIFDGQHRFMALRQYLGEGWQALAVPCRVYEGLTNAEVAEICDGLNSALAWTAIAKFKNAVTREDPAAVAITRIVRRLGLTIREETKANTVRAVKALRTVFLWPDGEALLEWSASLLHEAWPDHPNALHQCLIKGTAILRQRFPDGSLDRDSLLRRLQGHESPDEILGKARAHARIQGSEVQQGVVEILKREYNVGRRTGKLK